MGEPREHKAVFDLFLEACELERDKQAAFLDEACDSNQTLRDEVEALLSQARARSEGSGAPTAAQPSGGADETIEATGRPDGQRPNSRVRVQTPHPSGINIEGYQIVGELGRGGMGVVYEALQVKLNRHVALKILPAMPGATNLDAVARFRREATAAAKLHHSGIVPIYDFGQSGHTYYYAMEVVHGRPLNEMIHRFSDANVASASQTRLAELLSQATAGKQDASNGTTSSAVSSASSASHPSSGSASRGRVYYRQVARWMSEAADALNYAHSQGIIHRDIKPGNLMPSREGRIMILDFGLAKSSSELSVTMTGSLLGTLRYMSPEQAMAKRMKVDHRTDIYSLGATMYELLTFQPAFQGRDEKETLGQIITKEPTPPRKIASHVPRELETICLKTLEKDAGARYATAQDLADDLRRYVQGLPIVARPVGPIGRVVKFVRRRRAFSAAVCATVFLAISVFLAARYQRRASLERQGHQEAAIRERAQRVEALLSKGIMFWQNRNWLRAEGAFTDALRLDPDNERVLGNFASLKRIEYAIQRDPRLLDEAKDLLDHALDVHPNSGKLWNIKGVVLRLQGQLPEAMKAHQRGAKANPEYYPNWVSIANLQARLGHLDQAESSLLKAVALPDGANEVMVWYNLLAVQLHLSKPQALDTVQRLPDKANRSSPVTLLKAKLYLQLAGHEDFKKALRLATSADVHSGSKHKNALVKRTLALAELRNENWAEAVDEAEAALDAGDTLAAYPHLILAIALAHQDHTDQAREHLQQARDDWPAALERSGYLVTIPGGYMWFESAAELAKLRTEAEAAIAPGS